jgi:hypothetical protein
MDLRSGIANVVFGDSIDPDVAAREDRLVQAVFGWLGRVERKDVHESCLAVDQVVVTALSGPNILRLAQQLDARCPEVIQNMPTMSAHLSVLAVAERTARFFAPANIESLRRALADEGDA